MKLDIKTSEFRPRRQTYDAIVRRTGGQRPASRYDEASYDIQATANFHYRPTWDPAHEIHDPSRTAIRMDDWYRLRDPRQFYYATYNIARARMMEAVERNFSFVEKRGLLNAVGEDWRETVRFYLLPLRHYEWGANMNNCQITDEGYGTVLTQATMFAATDRLGMAQIISRIGLLFDGNSGEALAQAKRTWLEDPAWQELRRLVEDSFVLEDWFQLFVLQNFAMDGVVLPLVYGDFDEAGVARGATALSMLTEFMTDWLAETRRWVDAVLKVAATESDENAGLISGWARDGVARARDAMAPIAQRVLGESAGTAALDRRVEDLRQRAEKLGLDL